MRLLVLAPREFPLLEMVHSEPDVEVFVGTDAASLRSAARTADAVLVAPRYGEQLLEIWEELENVRWIHTLAAGVEFLPFDRLRGSGIVVTNSRGVYADALGEFVIAAMLWFAKDLRRMNRNQSETRWDPFTVERLAGKTAGIIGYGSIGRAVGDRAAALGMKLLTARRTGDDSWSLDELVATSDYVVLSSPLTSQTSGLLSRRLIELLKSSAVVINVGRGATVDEEALVEALRQRRIRGAALDVFEVEPLPAAHPLWGLDNVLISPHTADHTDDAHQRAMELFLWNLQRFRDGDGLLNIVEAERGY